MQPTLSHMSIANTRLLGTVREAVLPPLLDAFADVFDGLREPLLLQADAMEQDRAAFIDALFNLRQRRDVGGGEAARLGARPCSLCRAIDRIQRHH